MTLHSAQPVAYSNQEPPGVVRAQAVVVAVLAVALAVVTAWMVQGTVPHNLYSLYRVYSVTHIPSQCRHHRSVAIRGIPAAIGVWAKPWRRRRQRWWQYGHRDRYRGTPPRWQGVTLAVRAPSRPKPSAPSSPHHHHRHHTSKEGEERGRDRRPRDEEGRGWAKQGWRGKSAQASPSCIPCPPSAPCRAPACVRGERTVTRQ